MTPFFSCSAQSSKSHTANGDHYDNAKTKKKCIALAKIAKEWTSRANNKQMTNVNNYLANDFRNSRKHDDEKAELSSEQNFSDQLYKKAKLMRKKKKRSQCKKINYAIIKRSQAERNTNLQNLSLGESDRKFNDNIEDSFGGFRQYANSKRSLVDC